MNSNMQGINRRKLLKVSAGLGLATMVGKSAWAVPPPPPPKAVFIFVPMGALPNAWHPDACQSLENFGSMFDPFIPIADRCVIPTGMNLPNAGFGMMPFHLCKDPFSEDSNSLDALMAEGKTHLRLLASEYNDLDKSGVTVESGKIIPISEYQNDPQVLLDNMSLFGLPDSFDRDILTHLKTSGDSDFSWRAKSFLELTKVALQTGHSDVVTLMLGGDNAQIRPPEHLGLPENTLRAMPPNAQHSEFIAFKRYIHSLVADFIADLANMTDANGFPMLDNTMIYMFSNMGHGDHYSGENAPAIFCGPTTLSFPAGRVMPINNNYELLNAISAKFGWYGKFGDSMALNFL